MMVGPVEVGVDAGPFQGPIHHSCRSLLTTQNLITHLLFNIDCNCKVGANLLEKLVLEVRNNAFLTTLLFQAPPLSSLRGRGVRGDGTNQAREGEAGPEYWPTFVLTHYHLRVLQGARVHEDGANQEGEGGRLTLPHMATQLKERSLKVLSPSSGPTGPNLKLFPSTDKYSEPMLRSRPTRLGPTPGCQFRQLQQFLFCTLIKWRVCHLPASNVV